MIKSSFLGKELAMPDSQLDLNARINELVNAGNIQAAVKTLYDAIVEAAFKKDFTTAEALRDRLYEVDAMALTEIVKSGEIIEQIKSEAIDPDHKFIWSSLYGLLSKEEANAFFFAVEEHRVDTNQTIIKQGQMPAGLLFINKGQAKLVWQDAGTEALLAKLEAGNVAGHDTFFDISMATTSLIALTPVQFSLLKREKTKSWNQAAPALLNRLKDYCRQFENPCDLVKKKGVERRKHPRFQLAGKAKLQLLNSAGAVIGKPLKGDLSNISNRGLSFQILLPNQQTAVMLLGRSLRMAFSMGEGTTIYEMTGTIISITDLWLNEFAAHVSFDTPLPPSLKESIHEGSPLK
jgi:CRP-like cAMP-binding protein